MLMSDDDVRVPPAELIKGRQSTEGLLFPRRRSLHPNAAPVKGDVRKWVESGSNTYHPSSKVYWPMQGKKKDQTPPRREECDEKSTFEKTLKFSNYC